jgi:hypothetical protein
MAVRLRVHTSPRNTYVLGPPWRSTGKRGSCSPVERRIAPDGERRWWAVSPPVADTCHSLADGPFAATRRFGNPSLRPAFLLKVAGSEPSGFLPVGR